jgi:hypothetical protein
MRLRILVAAAVLPIAACNVFGTSVEAPEGFQGWFHVERPGRATSLGFGTQNVAVIHDLGCDQVLNGETQWTQDGDALVLPQWSGSPRFTQDPSDSGTLVAAPGMYGAASELWLPGATCLVCPPGDAGVAVACSEPEVLDGGS